MITGLAGNGRVLLTINEQGEWNELFYPYPGQFQHLREIRLGLYEVEAHRFHWLRPGSPFKLRQEMSGPGSVLYSEWATDDLRVAVTDQVHPDHDLIVRTMRLTSPASRAVRLFSYHSLQIAESVYQDTAYVDADGRSVVHYKRGYYFRFLSDPQFSRAVCGQHTLHGLKGTYVDAEDGQLEGRLISHGAADSAMQWDLNLTAGAEAVVRLFVAIGLGLSATQRLASEVRSGDPGRIEREAEGYWRTWVARHPPHVKDSLPDRALELYRASVLVMRHASADNGSIIASPDTRSLVIGGDSYNYCWMRDGAYVSKAMDESGLYEGARRFLHFCQLCQTEEGYFLQGRLNASLPGLDRALAQSIVDRAHQLCPYSKATRGNINAIVSAV